MQEQNQEWGVGLKPTSCRAWLEDFSNYSCVITLNGASHTPMPTAHPTIVQLISVLISFRGYFANFLIIDITFIVRYSATTAGMIGSPTPTQIYRNTSVHSE